MRLTIFSFFSSAMLLFACSNDPQDQENQESTSNVELTSEDSKFEDRMAQIDNNEKLSVLNSLAYNNNEGSREEARAYLDKNNNEVKIEEVFSDAKTGNYGQYIFYIDNGKRFATKAIYYDNQLEKPSFIERVSYYDKNGKVKFTKERLAEYEEDLPDAAFSVVKPKDLPIDRTLRILNQEGEFVTTFQGFAEGNNMKYLLVGENKPDGYASSLAVQYEEGDIRKLMKNERAMIGKPLEVTHNMMMDERGLKFQILMTVKIL